MKRRVVVVGDLVTDVLAVLAGPPVSGSDTAAEIQFLGGGSAANTAAWLARQGTPVTLVAATGDDDAGRIRTAELTAAGVACAVTAVAGAATGTVVVIAVEGERTMLCDRGANDRLSAADVDATLRDAGDVAHLHLSGYALLAAGSRPAGRYALATARARGLTMSVDAASAQPLRRAGPTAFLDWIRDVDLLLANHDEARVLGGDGPPEALAHALTEAARSVVVKLGAAGAVWASRDGGVVHRPAPAAEVVDPTGAGDAFAAGLLDAWLGGAGPAAALGAGAALGALAVARPGGRPRGPSVK